MGNRYDEDGEILEFVGREKTHVRGNLNGDSNGREWISTDGYSVELSDLIPNEAKGYAEGGSEYRFTFAVHVEKATGEFKDDNDD